MAGIASPAGWMAKNVKPQSVGTVVANPTITSLAISGSTGISVAPAS
jgi:hypothetical protein